MARLQRVFVSLLCFGLSDEGIADAIYDSQAIAAVVGIDAGHESSKAPLYSRQIRDLACGHEEKCYRH
ncbi:hypothetical protein H4V96_000902 [Janthinobacterium sp. CG_23.4]|nr:hypothetical protein [Janthinobacterium sp. CG_23.4]